MEGIAGKRKLFHVIVVFYESRDEFKNYENISRVDLASSKENEEEAVKECVERAKKLMKLECITHNKTQKEFFYVSDIIEKYE